MNALAIVGYVFGGIIVLVILVLVISNIPDWRFSRWVRRDAYSHLLAIKGKGYSWAINPKNSVIMMLESSLMKITYMFKQKQLKSLALAGCRMEISFIKGKMVSNFFSVIEMLRRYLSIQLKMCISLFPRGPN